MGQGIEGCPARCFILTGTFNFKLVRATICSPLKLALIYLCVRTPAILEFLAFRCDARRDNAGNPIIFGISMGRPACTVEVRRGVAHFLSAFPRQSCGGEVKLDLKSRM